MRRFVFLSLLVVVALPATAQDQPLTLDRALAQAAQNHPILLTADQDVLAAHEKAEQAGAWSNPTLFLKLEDAPRTGDVWNEANRIWGLSQEIPWSGRLGATKAAAQAVTEQAQQQRRQAKHTVEADVRASFAAAIHARDVLALRQEGVNIAERLLELTSKRVDVGDAPEMDLRRARMEVGAAKAEMGKAHVQITNAYGRLAQAMGVEIDSVSGVSGDLDPSAAFPNLETLLEQLAQSPRLQLAGALITQNQALITEASRRRYPDLELEAGLRRAPDGNAFDAGVSIAVPILDRGGARLSAARADAAAAQWRLQSQRTSLEAAVRSAHAQLVRSLETATLYDQVVIPDADATLHTVDVSYAAGDTDLTGVLQITRDWLEVRMVRLDALLDAARSRAALVDLL